VTRDQLLSRLYGARKQLNRLIILTAPQGDEADELEELLKKQNQLVWHINGIVQSELVAATAGIHAACAEIDACTAELTALTARVHSIAKAIEVADKIIAVAATIATKVQAP
jgi:hypothetical protein